MESVGRCDVLLISGGIGPTEDDLTRQALAAVMSVPLELNEAWLESCEASSAAISRPMPEANRIQAMIPAAPTMIYNHRRHRGGHRRDVRLGRPEDDLPRLRHARRAEGNEDDVHARRPAAREANGRRGGDPLPHAAHVRPGRERVAEKLGAI